MERLAHAFRRLASLLMETLAVAAALAGIAFFFLPYAAVRAVRTLFARRALP